MAILSEEELYMAKEECVRLGECTASYYIVNLLSEVEVARSERKKPRVVNVGCGEIVTNYGTYNGVPAVFIEPADRAGIAGEEAPGYSENQLRSGSIVLAIHKPAGVSILIDDLNSAQAKLDVA